MNTLYSLIDSQTINNVVITLLHSLWQGILVAMGLWMYLNKADKSTARARYAISFFSLITLMAMLILTYSSVSVYRAHAADITGNGITQKDVSISSKASNPVSSVSIINAKAETDSGIKSFGSANESQSSNNSLLLKFKQNWQSIVFILYLAGALIMTVRFFVLLGGAYKLKNSAKPERQAWRIAIFDELAEKMQLAGKVILTVSDKVIIPCTIGFIKPVILLPASILVGIDENQLRAILAHELTHIKRHDWLFNIVQMFIEAVLFFNPAMWWISRHIRLERESACDEGVVGQTKKPREYAQLLLELARLDQKPAMAAALRLKFSSGGQSSISERIKRLTIPGHRSAGIRPGIIPAIIIFCLISLAFCSIQKGTETTLEYIGKYLSPQERADVMNKINEEYSAETGLFDEDQKVTIRGMLVTEDGDPLPTRTGEDCNGRTVTSVDVSMEVYPYVGEQEYIKMESDGSFEIKTRFKRFYIVVRPRRDYTTSFFGPFEFAPSEVIEDFYLPVDPGFAAKIKFVNEQGDPVTGVEVTGGYPHPPNYNSWHHTIKSVGKEDGITVIEHAADELANFSCEAPGYVKEARQKIKLSSDEPYVWQLTSTPATKVHIVSDKDGQPVSQAAVNLSGKEYWQISAYRIEKPIFVADDKGLVELKSLDQTESYLALVHAKGYQRQYINILGGDEITVRLKKFTLVKGKITGDLSGLTKDEKGLYFQFRNFIRLSSNSTSLDSPIKVYVEMIDNEAHFQIDKYYGHKVNIYIGSVTHRIDIDEDDISNIVIDIPLPSSYKKRKIVFSFVSADNSENLPITGKFKLAYRERPDDRSTKSHEIDIIDGKAEVEIVMPNHISWKLMPDTNWFFYREWKDITDDHSGSETIKCYPAGAIFGKITNPSEEFSRAYMNIHAAKKSPLLDKNRSQSPIVDFDQNIDLNPDGTYYIAPVPLGGEYAISASSKNMYWLSEDIKLTEKKPICELNISLPADLVDIKGQVLYPDGNPISGIGYKVDKNARHGGGTHSNDAWSTDSEGRFEIKGVNPDSSIENGITFDAAGFVKKHYDLKIKGLNRIVLERALTVKGVLLDKDTKQPLPDMTITFWPKKTTGNEYFKVRTDSKGRFVADQFGDTEYSFRLEKDGLGGYNLSENQIDPSKDSEVELYTWKWLK